jgi:hypothetical protein
MSINVLGIIPDGYTESGAIQEVPRLYPRVEITWRPMLGPELADYYQQVDGLKGKQVRQLAAGHLAGKLKKWDVKGPDGAVLPITSANVLLLKDRLFARLWSIVTGQDAPDEAPGKSPEDVEADLQDAIRAAETGQSVQAVREARQKGN